MNKTILLISAVVGLIIAGIGGYALTKSGTTLSNHELSGCSETAYLAGTLELGEKTLSTIQSMDKAFMQKYRETCARLCEKRGQLFEYLKAAKADDTQALQLLARIHEIQSAQEQATYGFVIAVRDVLPVKQRGEFIDAIQQRWLPGQKYLKNIAAGTCCGTGTNSRKKGESENQQE